MKKIVAAFVAGALFMFSAQTFGTSSNFVGLKITNTAEVNLDAKSIGEAIVVEGKSFIPLRSAADELDLKITRASRGVINLESANTLTPEELAQKAKEDEERVNNEIAKKNAANSKRQEIESVKTNINSNQQRIADYETAIKYVTEVGFNADGVIVYTAPNSLPVMYNKDTLAFAESEIIRFKAENVSLQAKVTQLEAELAELEK